jgi:hypothetical protein
MRKRPVSRVWLYVIGVVVVIAALTWVQFSIKSLGNELERARSDNAALAKQVKELGGTPVVAPPPIKGISTDDVRAIVTDELTKNKVNLTQGQVSQIARVAASMVPKPKNGTTPTPAQVQGVVSATINAFCAQGSQPCRGKTGPKGQDAPPITEDQLSAVVGAFCGEDAVNCRGPRGETGAAGRGIKSITKSGETVTVTYTDDTADTFTVADGKDGGDGAPGADGRGIKSVTCQANGDWLIVYTDDTTSTTDGPCRVVPPIGTGN